MKSTELQTDLAAIGNFAAAQEAENDAFRGFLQSHDSAEIDALVAGLDAEITPLINCTDCGNCCKSLMINVEEQEADKLASHLNLSRGEFENRFIEKGFGGRMLVSAIPCHFLEGNKCSVYEHRFAGCREFPALHLPGFKQRAFTTFMHYERCPIIFNVVERLKDELHFPRQ